MGAEPCLRLLQTRPLETQTSTHGLCAPSGENKTLPGFQGARAHMCTSCASKLYSCSRWEASLGPQRRQGAPRGKPPLDHGAVPQGRCARSTRWRVSACSRSEDKIIPRPAAVWGWGSETARPRARKGLSKPYSSSSESETSSPRASLALRTRSRCFFSLLLSFFLGALILTCAERTARIHKSAPRVLTCHDQPPLDFPSHLLQYAWRRMRGPSCTRRRDQQMRAANV